MAPAQRKRIMLKLAELMMKNREELALLETLDMGKPIAFSTTVDVPGSANTVQWFAEAIDKIYDEVAPTPGNVIAMITREATGVMACVVPWNFPLLMACWKISPALAAGNSVILKPAEQSPLTALRLAELAAEAREVSDVTGAGDTVIATMTLALAAGAPLVDAAQLANQAAGIVVGKFGPATVTLEELSGQRT